MEFNSEGTFQRGNDVLPNPINNTQDENKLSFQRQRTFKSDSFTSSSYNHRSFVREQQNIKGHVFLEPKWNNSFGLETPLFAVLALIIIGVYLFLLSRTDYFETDTQRIVGGLIVFAIYYVECYYNGVYQYLNNMMTLTQLQKYLQEIRNIPFKLQYQVTAYHYEHREEYNNSTKKYENKRVSVQTYSETFDYPLEKVIDLTEDSTIFFEKAKFFRIHNFVSFSYGDRESEKYYEDLKQFAINKSKRMDAYQTESEKMDCPGLITKILAYSDNVKLDPLFSKGVYFVYCLIGMSLVYRILLNKRVSFVEHCVHKQITYDQSRAVYQIYNPFNTINQLQRQQLDTQQKLIENQETLIKQQQQFLQQQLQNNQQFALHSEIQNTNINTNMITNPVSVNYDYPQEPTNLLN